MATGSSSYEILGCDFVSPYDGANIGGISSYTPTSWTTASYEVRGGSGGSAIYGSGGLNNSRGKRSQYITFDELSDFYSIGINSYNYESPTVNIDFKELNLDFEKWMLRSYGKPKNEYEVELI